MPVPQFYGTGRTPVQPSTLTLRDDNTFDLEINVGHKSTRHGYVSDLVSVLGPPMPIGLMPPAIRWVSPDMHHVLLERPPRRSPVWYSDQMLMEIDEKDESHGERYVLWVPWTVTMVSFSPNFDQVFQYKIFCRNTPMIDEGEGLAPLPLPNTWSDSGDICCTHDFQDRFANLRNDPNTTWSLLVQTVANHAWETGFNNNALEGPRTPPECKDMGRRWEKWLPYWQDADLDDVLSWTWTSITTVRELQENTLAQAGQARDYARLYAAAMQAPPRKRK